MYNSNCDNMNGGFFRSTERATKYTHNDRVVLKAPVLGYPPHVVANCGPQVWEFCVMSAKDGKPCKRCGTNDWYDGGHCKKCQLGRVKKWKQENPGIVSGAGSRYWLNNKEKIKEYQRQWRQENPEKDAERNRRWMRDNSDRVAERTRRWRKNNPDKVAATVQRRRTQKTQAGGSYTAAEFKALCDRYGNKCLRCGRTDVKLEFDHVLPVSKGGTSDIGNGQPLCRSCNARKNDRHIDYRPDAGMARWIQAKLFG